MLTHLPNPRLLVLALLTLAAALAPLDAQDVTIGAPVTYTGLDNDQNLGPLKLTSSPAPKFPKEMLKSSDYGYVIILSPPADAFERDLGSGYSTKMEPTIDNSYEVYGIPSLPKNYVCGLDTSLYFGKACAGVMSQWKWDPGFPDENDPRRAWVPVIFNPASASATNATATPRLLAVAPVIAPQGMEMPLAQDRGQIRAAVIVEPSGEIKKVTVLFTISRPYLQQNKEAINEAVSRTIFEKWKFAPARKNGVAVQAVARVKVLLLPPLPAGEPVAQGVTSLKSLKQADTVYPKTMQNTGAVGKVTLQFALDAKGRPQNPVVVLSPNAAFDKPALDALRKWRFAIPDPKKPDSLGNTYTKLGDARWQYEVNFAPPRMVQTTVRRSGCSCGCGMFTSCNCGMSPVMSATFTTAVPGTKTKGQNIPRPALAPENVKAVAPVYPYELLVKNVTGSATVRIPCNAGWPEARPEIINNSQADFGYALAAAMRYYTIQPRLWRGEPAPTMLTTEFDFNPANPDLRLTPGTLQLLADETQNSEKIISESRLDSPLKFRAPAPLPSIYVNGELKGATIIEFLIDKAGHVRLPRIIQTENPEAAYILMQQISMRIYAPPMQNGKPVVARARETVNFDATENLADK